MSGCNSGSGSGSGSGSARSLAQIDAMDSDLQQAQNIQGLNAGRAKALVQGVNTDLCQVLEAARNDDAVRQELRNNRDQLARLSLRNGTLMNAEDDALQRAAQQLFSTLTALGLQADRAGR